MKRKGNYFARREFLGFCGRGACALASLFLAGLSPAAMMGKARADMPRLGRINLVESPWYESLDGQVVRCSLCPRQCRINIDGRGECGVRENRKGRLYSLVFGNPCAIHLDPVEKNPLFHVMPSTMSLCLATAGCNLHCRFCQVWEMSQVSPEDIYSFDLPPESAIRQAHNMNARSIAFTYVEPVVFIEYAMAVAARAREAGLLSLVHTAGFIREDPLYKLCDVTDAFNVDLKGFSEEYYRELCAGELKPVLDTLRNIRRRGIHAEITTLIVPARNDEKSMIRDMAHWIMETMGEWTPLHFTRFYPLYRLRNLPPTPIATLERARETALDAGLKFVYLGGVPGHKGENTFCPNCSKTVIQRTGFMVVENRIAGGACGYCGGPVPGLWDSGD
ncbi:MAG: AmmeMemoRadiSam system radical SAM enzyme [Syntrophales bacterium]|nr:AmmeMemoRadiSam system radical SAM enzyme [Syntrophales bacterium]